MQLGIHLSYWQNSWKDDLLPLIRRSRQAGFEIAEFPLLFPGELKTDILRAELEANGMHASCGTGLGPETDITHPDPDVRRSGLAYLRQCVEVAARLGSPVLGGVTYAPWGSFPTGEWQVRRARCIESLRTAADYAAEVGVTLCLEVLNRFEGYLVNRVEDGLEILNAVGSPHLKLHLDTFHLNIEADGIGDEIAQAGAALGHFHCSENNRKMPGQGHIPWEEVRQGLERAGYNGYLVVEAFTTSGTEVGQGLNIWHSAGGDLDQAAAQGAAFLRSIFGDD